MTEAVIEKGKGFLKFLREESPQTVTAIEKVPQEPLNYGEAVLEVERAAGANPQVKAAMEDLVVAAQGQEIPNLDSILNNIIMALPSLQGKVESYGKMAQEIRAEKGAITAQKVEIHKQVNNYS